MILLKNVLCRRICNRNWLNIRTLILSDVTRKLNSTDNLIKSEQSSDNKFIDVYRLPLVYVFGLINRLKVYCTVYSGVCLPACLYLDQMQILENPYPMFYLSFGTCVILYSFGNVVNNLVGIVQVDMESKIVKLSYLNFWGKRCDVQCPIDDIQPLSAPKFPRLLPYKYIHRDSTKQVLKLYVKPTMIYENTVFSYIFGDVE